MHQAHLTTARAAELKQRLAGLSLLSLLAFEANAASAQSKPLFCVV
jgi:hypothetical protein